MYKLLWRVCGATFGMAIACVSGMQVCAATPGLTEMMRTNRLLRVVADDITLDCQVAAGCKLGPIEDGCLQTNKNGATLAKDISILLSHRDVTGIHRLTGPLEVRADDGREYHLRPFTVIRYALPASSCGYAAIIPSGASLAVTNAASGLEYSLAQGIQTRLRLTNSCECTLFVDVEKTMI